MIKFLRKGIVQKREMKREKFREKKCDLYNERVIETMQVRYRKYIVIEFRKIQKLIE